MIIWILYSMWNSICCFWRVKFEGMQKIYSVGKRTLDTLKPCNTYRKTSNVSRTLEGNEIVDQSDVVGASPVGAAPTTSSFST